MTAELEQKLKDRILALQTKFNKECAKNAELIKDAAAERERAEQLTVQLAGCSVAALGWTSAEQIAKPGDYGYSPAYQDVLNLRQQVEALRSVLAKAGTRIWEHHELGHIRKTFEQGPGICELCRDDLLQTIEELAAPPQPQPEKEPHV